MLTMKVSPELLKAHIAKLNQGILDFSEVEMNCRADLVRFEGLTVEQAASMDEDEMYRFLDVEPEHDDWEPNNYGFTCSCGSKDLKMQWINGYPGRYSSDDGYLCKCNCGKEFFIHECALDVDFDDESEAI
ncbi:hypothetical protein OMP38_14665 [Cohnella ginsengisoli]|uniref:Uncharacterized protein n=1 Tax=Cohnella ginsengisoli TaxID=425004 RepID=A0A9X4QMG2_9BACL|nr:hypothetical protein [Cohnella ginsengisoli]MDG0791959.1 hypothetical protein [Cohnella ginsengisoli]